MLLVRVLLQLGPEALGVVLVLGVATGLAISVQDFLTTGLVPELAIAYHARSKAPDEFAGMLAAAHRLCRRAAAGVGLAFVALALLTPLVGFTAEYEWAARLYLLAKGAEWLVGVGFVPHRSLCLIAEKTTTLNLWVVAERFADVTAAAVAVLWIAPDRPGVAIVAYGFLSAGLTAATTGIALRSTRALAGGTILDGTASPSPAASLRLRRAIAENSTLGVAMNLYIRASLLIVQLIAGSVGAFAFGLAAQFSFYLRQAGMGLVLGIDGVAARARSADETEGVGLLLRRAMRWQAAVVMPGAVLVFVFAEPLLRLWAGPRIAAENDSLAEISGLVRILLIGVSARALSEGWMRALTGVGRARVIAGPVVAGALASPVICLAAALVAPTGWKVAAVATALSAVMALVQAVVMPLWTARRVGLSPADFYLPLGRPLLATVIAAMVLTGATRVWPASPAWMLGLVFVLVYAAAACRIVVDAPTWRRLHQAFCSIPSPREAHVTTPTDQRAVVRTGPR